MGMLSRSQRDDVRCWQPLWDVGVLEVGVRGGSWSFFCAAGTGMFFIVPRRRRVDGHLAGALYGRKANLSDDYTLAATMMRHECERTSAAPRRFFSLLARTPSGNTNVEPITEHQKCGNRTMRLEDSPFSCDSTCM